MFYRDHAARLCACATKKVNADRERSYGVRRDDIASCFTCGAGLMRAINLANEVAKIVNHETLIHHVWTVTQPDVVVLAPPTGLSGNSG
jgi:hypothetical protein